MGSRILKESICTSESVDKLSWFEECFFYRLIVNCDDFGRMDARPAILKARLFPLKEGVTLDQIAKALNKLATANIASVYKYDGKPYLQLLTWSKHQRMRNQVSKYPEMSENNDTPRSNDGQVSDECRLESNTNTNTNTNIHTVGSAEPVVCPESEIFDYWNTKGIIAHRNLTEKLTKTINKALKSFASEQIKTCIDRYAQMLSDKEYFFKYRWSLDEFLSRKEGISSFTDEGSKWTSYKEWQSKPHGGSKNSLPQSYNGMSIEEVEARYGK